MATEAKAAAQEGDTATDAKATQAKAPQDMGTAAAEKEGATGQARASHRATGTTAEGKAEDSLWNQNHILQKLKA